MSRIRAPDVTQCIPCEGRRLSRARPLHVGLDLVYWVPDSGGSGTYASELIPALHAAEPGSRVTAWVGRDAPQGLDRRDWGGRTSFVHLPVRSVGSPTHLPMELFGLGLDAARRGVDVVHGLAYVAPVVAPRVATVVSLLDVAWRHYPEALDGRTRLMFRLLSTTCGRRCDRVVTISESMRDEVVRTLRLAPSKVDVTPLGVAPPRARATPEEEMRAALGIADVPIILCVAQLTAHKNLLRLVEAIALLRRSSTEEPALVLTGRMSSYAEAVKARARLLGVDVVVPGFVDASDLEGLYGAATAVVLPSLHEGFGLPVLEAMQRGVPVACSDASSLPEVSGGAALLFDPTSTEAIAAACRRLLQDPLLREELVLRGRARAAELTWEKTARSTLAVYRRALANRRASGMRG
ncbi:MAG: glycosyltransferase family 4 protein [Acidimicrobiales bacterium]|nr:glycosyltransferase family 4 protein [Acidimicrobiales bacterium]